MAHIPALTGTESEVQHLVNDALRALDIIKETPVPKPYIPGPIESTNQLVVSTLSSALVRRFVGSGLAVITSQVHPRVQLDHAHTNPVTREVTFAGSVTLEIPIGVAISRETLDGVALGSPRAREALTREAELLAADIATKVMDRLAAADPGTKPLGSKSDAIRPAYDEPIPAMPFEQEA